MLIGAWWIGELENVEDMGQPQTLLSVVFLLLNNFNLFNLGTMLDVVGFLKENVENRY